MKYLLDTHALVWSVSEPQRLSPAAQAAIESGEIRVSVVSLWELIVKKKRKDPPVREPLPWWERHVSRSETEVLPIRVRHVTELDALPAIHADPFDRMLLAQARAERLRLVTADAMLARYNVETVW